MVKRSQEFFRFLSRDYFFNDDHSCFCQLKWQCHHSFRRSSPCGSTGPRSLKLQVPGGDWGWRWKLELLDPKVTQSSQLTVAAGLRRTISCFPGGSHHTPRRLHGRGGEAGVASAGWEGAGSHVSMLLYVTRGTARVVLVGLGGIVHLPDDLGEEFVHHGFTLGRRLHEGAAPLLGERPAFVGGHLSLTFQVDFVPHQDDRHFLVPAREQTRTHRGCRC